MSKRHDLQTLVRRSDPHPDGQPLPEGLLTDRPSAVDIIEAAAARRSGRAHWSVPLVAAVAAGIVAFLAVGAVLFFVAPSRNAPPADQPSPTVSVPGGLEGDAGPDGASSVEPAGTGPALVWHEVTAPGNGVVGTVLWNEGRFYLADYHPDDDEDGRDPRIPGSWYSSSDGLVWQRIEGSEDFPDEGELVAVDGRLVRIELPAVASFDVETGEIAVSRLDMGPLLEIDDPCFEPGPVCGQPHPVATAGGQGALVVVHPWSIPTLEICPPAGDDTSTLGLGEILGGGRVVADGCWVVNHDHLVHPLAWFSADGLTWSAVPRRGPFSPGRGIILDAVSTDSGFVLLREELGDGETSVWFSADGMEWEQIATPDGFQGVALSSWGDMAIAASDTELGWGDAVRGVEPLWLVSPTGISRLESEPLPELLGAGGLTAGPAGIVVTYAVESNDSNESEPAWDLVLEFSVDGFQWSRRAVGEGDDVVVGDQTVLRIGETRLGSTPLFIGIPESSDGR